MSSSLPHGGVDRNSISFAVEPLRASRSLTGAWIETHIAVNKFSTLSRRSLTGAWIETTLAGVLDVGAASLPHGGVDRNGQC